MITLSVRLWLLLTLLAQMAFVEAGNATVDEVFLPYLRDKQGQTLYQAFCENRLMLPGMGE